MGNGSPWRRLRRLFRRDPAVEVDDELEFHLEQRVRDYLSTATVYALMSFTVTQRRREIGIRCALGAPSHRVLLSIFSRVASQVGLGVAVGVVAGVFLERMTGGVTTGSRMAMIVPLIALIVVVVGLCAAFGPARQSLRVQPVDALRAE